MMEVCIFFTKYAQIVSMVVFKNRLMKWFPSFIKTDLNIIQFSFQCFTTKRIKEIKMLFLQKKKNWLEEKAKLKSGSTAPIFKEVISNILQSVLTELLVKKYLKSCQKLKTTKHSIIYSNQELCNFVQ